VWIVIRWGGRRAIEEKTSELAKLAEDKWQAFNKEKGDEKRQAKGIKCGYTGGHALVDFIAEHSAGSRILPLLRTCQVVW
jgi:hypothetical protein